MQDPYFHVPQSGMVGGLFFLLSCLPGLVSAETSEEYNAQAAVIVNFAKFSQGPQEAFASPGAPLTLWVVRKENTKSCERKSRFNYW